MSTLAQILRGAPLLTLHVNVPLEPESSVYLLQHGITIGRGPDNAIAIDHSDVGAPTHAQVYEDPDTGGLRLRRLETFHLTTTYDLDLFDIPLRPDAGFYIGEVRFDVGQIEIRTSQSEN